MAPPTSIARSSRNIANHPIAVRRLSTSTITKPVANKPLPIVRMVRVFAPRRVTTDPANFRAIVQRLTGNHGVPCLDADIDPAVITDNHHLAQPDSSTTSSSSSSSSCQSGAYSPSSSSITLQPSCPISSLDPSDLPSSIGASSMSSPSYAPFSSSTPLILSSRMSNASQNQFFTLSPPPLASHDILNDYQLSFNPDSLLSSSFPTLSMSSSHDRENIQEPVCSEFDAMMSWMQLPII